MAFGWGHYYAYGNSNNCVNQYSWFPDGSNWVYDSITYWYQWAFKRNAEAGGTYYWYSVFTNPAPPSQGGNSFVDGGNGANSTYNTPLFLYIYNAGIANGEYGANHTWLGAGYCPIPGCTNPNANNYNPSATQDNGTCTYNYGCTDPNATNYDPNAYINDGSCQYIIYGCTDPTANNYNPSANVNQGCAYDQPTVSLSSNPVSIIAGQSSTLSWSTNYAVSGTIQPINYSISPVSGGTRVVYPTSNTTYNLTVYGVPNGGKSASNTTTVVVYTPPNTNISLASSTIPLGNSTTLSWATTGDASSASINQGIGSVPLSSNTTVSPTSTTTYTINVSGNGGSDSDSVTLTVVPPPTASITVSPDPLPFGVNPSIIYSSTNSTNVTLYRYYTIDGIATQMTTTSLLVNSSNTYLTDTIDWTNTYNGTNSTLNDVRYVVSATNGTTSVTASSPTITTLTDMMPDLIVIPASGPLEPDAEPVISPDVTSSSLLVDDIDMPVEIKSDNPIKVDIDDAGNWQDVQQI